MEKPRYLIHTCNKRLWYVEKYLLPSMLEQGIKRETIEIYNDVHGEGQIPSLIKSLNYTHGDTWHLQDDIIISQDFRRMTEAYNDGIVCGFCNSFSKGRPGYVEMSAMWYSMPCIRIPEKIFTEFIAWLNNAETRKKYVYYFADNKHDDVFLEIFLNENYRTTKVHNLAPNIVNHIDHLIGGSLINQDRVKEPFELMATYWEEPQLLIDIEKRLRKEVAK